MRSYGKWKAKRLRTLHRRSGAVQSMRVFLCGGIYAIVPGKCKNHLGNAADLLEIHIKKPKNNHILFNTQIILPAYAFVIGNGFHTNILRILQNLKQEALWAQ